ncbi:MAG: type II toxin-antitoxin system VapB family antitoxin [Chloroflexota bacterium]|nr:type II toxin-antitoxin system VapB family antitoxin [Chloroflexota bacterium]
MSLNIKNAETYRLIRELAEATGESMTQAVTTAVRERLEHVRNDFDPDDIMELARDIRQRLPADFFDVEHGDLLYDEDGLPK